MARIRAPHAFDQAVRSTRPAGIPFAARWVFSAATAAAPLSDAPAAALGAAHVAMTAILSAICPRNIRAA
jgi:hypothetical protein